LNLPNLWLIPGKNPAERRKRARGLLRVFAYGTFLMCVFGGITAARAKSELGRRALSMGSDMQALAENLQDTNRFRLNGQVVNLSKGISDKPLKQIIAEYKKSCDQGGSIFEDVARLEAETLKSGDPSSAAGMGTVAEEGKDEGVVACLVRPKNGDGKDSPKDSQGLADALNRFAKSQDLSELGHIRYAHMRKLKSGRVRVVTLWTQSTMNLGALFPAEGTEAQGDEPTMAPRPPKSRALLHARIEDHPYAMHAYQSKESVPALTKFYDDHFEAQGFVSVGANQAGSEALGYIKDGTEFILSLTKTAEGTNVGMVEAGVTPDRAATRGHKP
jgi:hypothetical protein